jgi:hypothetical protein
LEDLSGPTWRHHTTRKPTVDHLVKPSDFVAKGELSGKTGGDGIYAMTDNVTDEMFEEAITEARTS